MKTIIAYLSPHKVFMSFAFTVKILATISELALPYILSDMKNFARKPFFLVPYIMFFPWVLSLFSASSQVSPFSAWVLKSSSNRSFGIALYFKTVVPFFSVLLRTYSETASAH